MSLIEKNEDAYFSKHQIRYYERIYQDERVEAPQPIVRYQMGEVIGYGSFGQVSRALNRDTGQLLAVKQVPLPRFVESIVVDRRVAALEVEIDILSRFAHKNIVKYMGKYNDGKHLNIFLEYVSGGSLHVLLQKYGRFNETLIRLYT